MEIKDEKMDSNEGIILLSYSKGQRNERGITWLPW